jgi:hypothetical protein
VEEDFDAAKAVARSPENRQKLMDARFSFRSQHREEDIRRGKRSAGFGVLMHLIMWAPLDRDCLRARALRYCGLCKIREGQGALLAQELRQALVAFAAAASMVEVLYGDVKYLIPERQHRSTTAKTIADCLTTAFGLSVCQAQDRRNELVHLFVRRNVGLHGYSELTAPELHPAGPRAGTEASRFNGPESRKAPRLRCEFSSTPRRRPNQLIDG